MRKFIFLLISLFFTTVHSHSQGKIFVTVYAFGLDPPIKRIIISELSTQQQLDAVISAIENEYVDSKKFGNTPIYATLDHMVEDLSASNIPEDSKVIFLLYTDGINTSSERNMYITPELRQYVNNRDMLDRFIVSRLQTPINGKPITVLPILTVGRQKSADLPFLQKICSHGERVYRFEEAADLIREKIFYTLRSTSNLILSIALDHSASMESINQAVAYDVIETIIDIYKKMNEKANDDFISDFISLEDFMDILGGPTFVGNQLPVRPDEIYFTFELSHFKIMKSPVSQSLFNIYLSDIRRENPSKILGGNQTNVSYLEILAFIEWLNARWNGPGKLRLPTEYELENMIRINPSGYSRGEPIVREFTSTFYADYDVTEKINPKGNPYGTHIVVRSYSYEDNDPMMNRPEYRGRITINESSPLTGFRLVLSFE